MLTETQRRQFDQDGFVIVDKAIEPEMLAPLREAAERVIARTRAGDWPHKRTAGPEDIWGVSHLLHPDLKEPVFAEYMASAPVLEVAKDLLGPDLRLGLVNMLVNPIRSDFAIGWHRDLLRRELPPDEEAAELARMDGLVQWNTALYEESCLLIIPGSHRRAATPEEHEGIFRQPMEPLPGQMAVPLMPGQGVYYNNLLIHRGVYPQSQQRATLHAALTSVDSPLYRFHYEALKWMEQPGLRETLPAPLQPLYDNWLHFAQECRRTEDG